jgi:hypothetical protein
MHHHNTGVSCVRLTFGSLATLGILKAAMVDILVVLGSLGVCCNLGLLAENAALVMPEGSDKSRSCLDAMVVTSQPFKSRLVV